MVTRCYRNVVDAARLVWLGSGMVETIGQHEVHLIPTGTRGYPATAQGLPDHGRQSNLGAFLAHLTTPVLAIDLVGHQWRVKTMADR